MHCFANGVRGDCDTMIARVTLSLRIRSAKVLMTFTPTLPSSAKNTKICQNRQYQTQIEPADLCVDPMQKKAVCITSGCLRCKALQRFRQVYA